MIETIVKVFLRDKAGNLDSFTTTINLPEQESHAYYLGRSWNMGVEGDRMMECYKVETVEAGHTISECARKVSERLSYHFAGISGGWNVPKDMPFMREFLNEVRTLCDLCFAAEPDDKTKNAQFPGRTYENIVSSFFFYMWNGWGTKEECRQVFGNLCDHFWAKWCEFFREYRGGAAEMFYAGLSDDNRRKLVERACAVYNGNSRAATDPALPQRLQVSVILDMITGALNEWWACQDYETRLSITHLTDEGFGTLDEHDRAMKNYWKELPVEHKITLWRQLRNKNGSETLYCAECGSADVEVMAWVKVNEGKMFSTDIGGNNDEESNYCESCGKHPRLLTRTELMEQIQSWWEGADSNTWEKITGISISRFDGGEIPAYESACQASWDALTDDEKIATWRKYNYQ